MPVEVSTESEQGIFDHHEECTISNQSSFIFENLKAFLKRKLLCKIINFSCLKLFLSVGLIIILITFFLLFFFSVLAVLENSDGLLMPPLEIYLNSAQNKITLICKHFNKLTEA